MGNGPAAAAQITYIIYMLFVLCMVSTLLEYVNTDCVLHWWLLGKVEAGQSGSVLLALFLGHTPALAWNSCSGLNCLHCKVIFFCCHTGQFTSFSLGTTGTETNLRLDSSRPELH